MKKTIALLLALTCLFCLFACGTEKYTCRPLEYREQIDLQPSTLTEPFVTDEEQTALLNNAVKKYLEDLNNGPVSFDYEITGTYTGIYENKETILCWLKILYGAGFTTTLGFIIQ